MVFDVDKLKEDIDLLTGSLDAPRLTPSQILVVGSLLKMGRLVVAGQPLWWCEEHDAPLEPETAVHVGPQSPLHQDHCWAVGAWGVDRNTMSLCRMVEQWRMPTGGGE